MPEQNVLHRPVPTPAQFDPEQALAEAIGHYHAGRTVDAERLYRVIIAARPDHAAALYSLGFLCFAQGRLQEAVDAYAAAVAIRPDYVDALINQGTALLALGQPQEAAARYQRAIGVAPDNAMAHGNLGKALQDLGQFDNAIAAYRRALHHQPANAVVNLNLGGVLLEQRDWQESIVATQQAIALDPHNPLAHANLGTALLNLGHHDAALTACRDAIALRPQNATVLASIGGAMLELGAWPEAEDLCRHAITLDPALPDAHFNLSHTLKALNRTEEAILAVREAIALRPDSAEFHFHLAHLLLLQGDFENGWAEYDWRWKLPDFTWLAAAQGASPPPRWAGEDIADKTILIHTEQGLGDILLFARYLPLVVARAGKVIVAAHQAVGRILESIAGITIVPLHLAPLPACDVQCPLLSLPRAFATQLDSIPATVPYLHTDPAERAHWNRRIGGTNPRVGIVWAGNPATKRDRFRSPGFTNIAPLLSVPGIDFIILQVGPGRTDLATAQLPPNVVDLGPEITDLADTAAIMLNLDLMISSCTGPLHLAGALGVSTWAIIPFAPYFPWLLDRTDSPWYPSAQLYRQEQPGQDWSSTVARIANDLAAWARPAPSVLPATLPATNSQPQTAASGGAIRMANAINNFTVLESVYGKLIVNRHCAYQADALIKTGYPHIEPELEKILAVVRSLPDGCVVVDAGANIGLVSIPIAQAIKSKGGVVHAFEVQRMLFYALCGSAAMNDLDNLFVHHKGLGASAANVNACQPNYRMPQDFGLYSLVDPVSDGHQEHVAIVAIDSLALNRLDFLKIDVEGMESDVLRGAQDAIRVFVPWCWIEYWKVGIDEIKSHFPSDAYTFYAMDALNLLCAPTARLLASGITISGSSL
jgi:FkbM family methyltransferase